MVQQFPPVGTLREAVGIFGNAEAVDQAVEELMQAGFDRADISLLAGTGSVRRRLGHDYQDTHLAEDDPSAPRGAWIDPESRAEGRGALTGVLAYLGGLAMIGLAFANGDSDAAALAGSAIGASLLGGVGYGLGRLIDRKLLDRTRWQLGRGGIVLWVKVGDDDHASRAGEVLARHGAADVHLHRMPAPKSDEPRWTPTIGPLAHNIEVTRPAIVTRSIAGGIGRFWVEEE